MDKQNFYDLQADLEKKHTKRAKKKKTGMKVSGAGVKELEEIIKRKAYNAKIKNQSDNL